MDCFLASWKPSRESGEGLGWNDRLKGKLVLCLRSINPAIDGISVPSAGEHSIKSFLTILAKYSPYLLYHVSVDHD
jgi:hypothetical protein